MENIKILSKILYYTIMNRYISKLEVCLRYNNFKKMAKSKL